MADERDRLVIEWDHAAGPLPGRAQRQITDAKTAHADVTPPQVRG
jgi:hypothetical protein